MAEPILEGRFTDSGDLLSVWCFGCSTTHLHQKTDAMKPGALIDLQALCAPSMSESSSDLTRLVANRSAWLGRSYKVQVF